MFAPRNRTDKVASRRPGAWREAGVIVSDAGSAVRESR